MFPDIREPYDVAMAEMDRIAGLLVDRGLEPGARATRTTLSACDPAVVKRLLASCLKAGPLAEMLQGGEPREVIREYYRLRRARELVEATGGDESDAFSVDLAGERDAFLAWYAKLHDDVPDAEDAGMIVSEWARITTLANGRSTAAHPTTSRWPHTLSATDTGKSTQTPPCACCRTGWSGASNAVGWMKPRRGGPAKRLARRSRRMPTSTRSRSAVTSEHAVRSPS
jgi:hypothetical protein